MTSRVEKLQQHSEMGGLCLPEIPSRRINTEFLWQLTPRTSDLQTHAACITSSWYRVYACPGRNHFVKTGLVYSRYSKYSCVSLHVACNGICAHIHRKTRISRRGAPQSELSMHILQVYAHLCSCRANCIPHGPGLEGSFL